MCVREKAGGVAWGREKARFRATIFAARGMRRDLRLERVYAVGDGPLEQIAAEGAGQQVARRRADSVEDAHGGEARPAVQRPRQQVLYRAVGRRLGVAGAGEGARGDGP